MALKKILLSNETIPAGETKRLLPGIDVSKWDRLHFHVGARARGIPDLSVRILFGTPIESGVLLADSTIWYEDTVSEREFSYATSSNCGGTGFVMSVPVITPYLYDVILRNTGAKDLKNIFVAVMAQEI